MCSVLHDTVLRYLLQDRLQAQCSLIIAGTCKRSCASGGSSWKRIGRLRDRVFRTIWSIITGLSKSALSSITRCPLKMSVSMDRDQCSLCREWFHYIFLAVSCELAGYLTLALVVQCCE